MQGCVVQMAAFPQGKLYTQILTCRRIQNEQLLSLRNFATGQLDPYHLNSDLWIEHLWVEITWIHSNSIINIEIQNIRCQYLLFRNTSIQTNSSRKILIQIDWTQHFLFHKNSIQNNLAPPLDRFSHQIRL